MSGITRVGDRLESTAGLMRRAIDALFQAVILVGLACVAALFIAGSYGILHNGNDFDFDVNLGTGGASGDVIVPTGVLR